MRGTDSLRVTDRWLFGIALGAVTAAVVFALLPVRQAVHVFTYRPAESTEVGPGVAPLAIARSVPDAIDLSLPCEAEFPLSTFRSLHPGLWWSRDDAIRSPLLYPDLGDGLVADVGYGLASVTLGSEQILSLDVVHGPDCTVELGFRNGLWTLDSGSESVTTQAPGPRFAEAMFEGPASTNADALVVVETRELGSSPSTAQIVLLLGALLALVVVARGVIVREPRPSDGRPSEVPPLWSVGAVDWVVFGLLGVWLFFIPAGFDDGWIVAIQGGYDTYGDFSGIYETTAVAPIGYWLHWIQHFWVGLTTNPLLLRLPIVAVGIATWTGLRWLARSLGLSDRSAATWVMGGVFAVGFGAWGMTWRPEPVIALLVVASLVLAVRFNQGRRGGILVMWALVVALGASAHTAGLMVAAPVLVSWRGLWRWARSDRSARYLAAATGALLAAVTLILFLVDSNLDSVTEGFNASRSAGHDRFLLDEWSRYGLLDEAPFGSMLRRAAVALIAFALAIFLVRVRRRDRSWLTSLPGWTLVVSLALLAFTPSKWAWHFGGLIGLVALVVAIELGGSARAPIGGDPSLFNRLRRPAAIVGLLVVFGIAWASELRWTAFDLRTLDWSISSGIRWGTLAVVGAGAAWLALTRRRRGLSQWSMVEGLGVIVTALLVAVTAATLVVDTATTSAWTFGRQNLTSLWGGAGCGLGDELLIPQPGSLHVLDSAAEAESPDADGAATSAGFPGGGLFEEGAHPSAGINSTPPLSGMVAVGSWVAVGGEAEGRNVGSHRTAWHQIGPTDERVALMVMGSFDGASRAGSGNAVGVQWGRASGGTVVGGGIEVGLLSGYFLDWSMQIFEPPEGFDRVRVLSRDDTTVDSTAWVAASAPLGLEVASLGAVASTSDQPVLISSPLALYFPCIETPRFDHSVVPTPAVLINMWPVPWQTAFAAAAASDRYFRVPIQLDPAALDLQIGAHLGDPGNFVFVSQEYLTGAPARVNGRFERLDG